MTVPSNHFFKFEELQCKLEKYRVSYMENTDKQLSPTEKMEKQQLAESIFKDKTSVKNLIESQIHQIQLSLFEVFDNKYASTKILRNFVAYSLALFGETEIQRYGFLYAFLNDFEADFKNGKQFGDPCISEKQSLLKYYLDTSETIYPEILEIAISDVTIMHAEGLHVHANPAILEILEVIDNLQDNFLKSLEM